MIILKDDCYGKVKINLKEDSILRLNNKNIYLGLFEKEEEAIEAYKQAKDKYHHINRQEGGTSWL